MGRGQQNDGELEIVFIYCYFPDVSEAGEEGFFFK